MVNGHYNQCLTFHLMTILETYNFMWSQMTGWRMMKSEGHEGNYHILFKVLSNYLLNGSEENRDNPR